MTTNREQVGKALELARDGLRPFVERCFRRSPGGLDQVAARLRDTEYEANEEPLSDIAALVRLMLTSQTWFEVFQPNLKRTVRAEVRSLVGELGSVRNRWAHQEAFTDDDAERALDTVRRLLRAINANEMRQAEEMLNGYRAARQRELPPRIERPVAPPPTPADEEEPLQPETPPPVADEDAHDNDGYREAAVQEIQRLRNEIAAKRAEREGLDVRRDYLEEDQLRLAREFEEKRRRIARESASVDAERKATEEEIHRLEEQLKRVKATVEPPSLEPPPPTGGAAPEPPEAPRPTPVAARGKGEPAVEREAKDEGDYPSGAGASRERTVREPDPPIPPHTPRRPASAASADLVCELLGEAGKPLHFRDIYRRLKSRETRPPRTHGGDPAIVYLARYSSDPRLERTGRGTYRLKGAAPPPPLVPGRRPRSSRTGQERASGGYTGKQAVAYTLWGRRHVVKSFKEVLLGVCGAVFERSPADFEKVLTLHGRKRPCFSRNPDDLLTPAIVRGSGIYAETKLSAGDIVRRCGQVLRVCGHDPVAFSVDAR